MNQSPLCCISRSVAILLGLTFPAICSGQIAQPISPAVIYERTHSSVVVVLIVDKDSNPIGQGSGFIVGKNRVVTNHHVIKYAATVFVFFADGASEEAEGILADSVARDLTILVVQTGSRSPLKLGDELAVRQGESVYAIGAPRGLELSITNGIVSGFRNLDDQFLLQTTAAIAPGSSGGPLFDSSGRVIGVTTSGLTDSPGIYFSVGARDISRMARTPGTIVPFAPKALKVAEPSPPAPPPNQPKPPQVSNGTGLVISTQPQGANIFLNGIKQSVQTPATLSIAPGHYDLVLRIPGHEPWVGDVQVKENSETTFNVELKELPRGHFAWADVSTTPEGAEILIDGTPTGRVSPARVQLSTGTLRNCAALERV
jgi:S1-C subfamily serine protease